MLFSERTHVCRIKGEIWMFLAVQKLSLWGFKVVIYSDDGKALTFSWCKFYLFFMTKMIFFCYGWFILCISGCKNCLFFMIEIVSFLHDCILLFSIHDIMLYDMVFCLNQNRNHIKRLYVWLFLLDLWIWKFLSEIIKMTLFIS